MALWPPSLGPRYSVQYLSAIYTVRTEKESVGLHASIHTYPSRSICVSVYPVIYTECGYIQLNGDTPSGGGDSSIPRV